MLAYGKASFWVGRGLLWVGRIIQPLNFLMLVYLTIQKEPIVLVMIPICAVAGLWMLKFDNKNVVEAESNYAFDKSPRFVKMEKDITEIKELLKNAH